MNAVGYGMDGSEIDILQPVIVVDWRSAGHSEYRVVRISRKRGLTWRAYGAPIWVKSGVLHDWESGPRMPSVHKTYVNYIREGLSGIERGCSCFCCFHHAWPKNSVRKDGSYIWEEEQP